VHWLSEWSKPDPVSAVFSGMTREDPEGNPGGHDLPYRLVVGAFVDDVGCDSDGATRSEDPVVGSGVG
jgi:hypothetical protein